MHKQVITCSFYIICSFTGANAGVEKVQWDEPSRVTLHQHLALLDVVVCPNLHAPLATHI